MDARGNYIGTHFDYFPSNKPAYQAPRIPDMGRVLTQFLGVTTLPASGAAGLVRVGGPLLLEKALLVNSAGITAAEIGAGVSLTAGTGTLALKGAKAATQYLDEATNSVDLAAKRSAFVFDESGQLARNGERTVFNQGNAPTCAPTSCGMILDTLGQPVDLVRLIERANVGPNGMSANRVADLLTGEGVNATFKARMTIDDLAKATANGNPAIAAVRQGGGGHAIVVDGVTTRQGVKVVAIRDPWGQQYFEKVDTFNQRFLRQGIIVNGKQP